MKNTKSLLKRLGLASTATLAVLPQYGCTADGDLDSGALAGIALMTLGAAGEARGNPLGGAARLAGQGVTEYSIAGNSGEGVQINNYPTTPAVYQTPRQTPSLDFLMRADDAFYSYIPQNQLASVQLLGDFNRDGLTAINEISQSQRFLQSDPVNLVIPYSDGDVYFTVQALDIPQDNEVSERYLMGSSNRRNGLVWRSWKPGQLEPSRYEVVTYNANGERLSSTTFEVVSSN